MFPRIRFEADRLFQNNDKTKEIKTIKAVKMKRKKKNQLHKVKIVYLLDALKPRRLTGEMIKQAKEQRNKKGDGNRERERGGEGGVS